MNPRYLFLKHLEGILFILSIVMFNLILNIFIYV